MTIGEFRKQTETLPDDTVMDIFKPATEDEDAVSFKIDLVELAGLDPNPSKDVLWVFMGDSYVWTSMMSSEEIIE